MSNLTIEFDNHKARKHFVEWLCNQGEQDYWTWMDYREEEDSSKGLTVTKFHYWDNGRLIFDTLKTTCGRMDYKKYKKNR